MHDASRSFSLVGLACLLSTHAHTRQTAAQAAALLHGPLRQVHALEAGRCAKNEWTTLRLPVIHSPTLTLAPHPVFTTQQTQRHTQTVFYLEQPLTICAGEQLKGRIASAPNERNNRDLDIKIEVEFEGRHSGCKISQEFRLR